MVNYILQQQRVIKLKGIRFQYTGGLCRCILGFNVSYPSVISHLPARFSSPLDRVSFAQTSQCYRVMFVARQSKIARKVRMRQQEMHFKRDVTCQFFVSVVKFTGKLKKTARWLTFANTLYVTTSRAFYAFHAESFISDTKLAV